MRREEIFITESVLRSLPELLRYLDGMEALFLRGGGSKMARVRKTRGGCVPEQQRIIERAERDAEYCRLSLAAGRLMDRYFTAPDSFRWALRDVFFFGEDIRTLAAMKSFTPGYIYRLKAIGVKFMAPVCLEQHPVIAAWRRGIEVKMLDFHRKRRCECE